jgi:NAD-dependent epimerase/dehydratase family protein
MKNNRREFIKASALGAAALSTGALSLVSSTPARAAQQSLDVLILGGTGFIGPHMVREALRRGYSVTLFNRGRTNNTLFPDLERIKGDRNNGRRYRQFRLPAATCTRLRRLIGAQCVSLPVCFHGLRI